MAHDDEVRRRQTFNRGSRTNRPLAKTAEEDGIAGEFALAHLLGMSRYRPATNKRTPGYQIIWDNCWKIKVTTSRTPFNLLVKQGKVGADVYILAGIEGEAHERNVYFVGWASSKDVKEAPVKIMTRKDGKQTTDYELASHAIARHELRPMAELAQIIGFPISWLDGRIREAVHYEDDAPKTDEPRTLNLL